jgi:hypothetical protein
MLMARPFRYLWKDFLAGRIDDETPNLKRVVSVPLGVIAL